MCANVAVIKTLNREIQKLERRLNQGVRLQPEFRLLTSVPGIGKTLATLIMLEVGTIERFAAVGNFASYARCVDSTRISNGKKKGQGNVKNGNAYLAWAFVEAANFAHRYCTEARRFYERKKARTNGVVATKALAHIRLRRWLGTCDPGREHSPDRRQAFIPTLHRGRQRLSARDVGGIPGYLDFLQAIADPLHSEHADMLRWCGSAFDPRGLMSTRSTQRYDDSRLRQCGKYRTLTGYDRIAKMRLGFLRPRRGRATAYPHAREERHGHIRKNGGQGVHFST